MKQNPIQKTQILAHIEKLALQLFQEKKIYARADIAYDLKSSGIDGDSSLIDDLIHELFNSTKKPEIQEAIEQVFYNNNFTRSIIDNSAIKQLIKSGELNKAHELFITQEQKVKDLLTTFSGEMGALIEYAGAFVKDKNLVAKVTGTYKVENVKNKAEALYQNYSKIVYGYIDAKQSVLNLIEDYSIIRTEIVNRYRENVTRLTDIFGPAIKAVEPVIFDFDTIEYLQADKMLENIDLEFDSIMKSCEEVVAIINDSIINDLSQSSKLIGKSKDAKAALALAGVAILKSHLKATKHATRLNQGVALMRQKMDYDTSSIEADLFRLQLINKTINEVSIPTAHIFQRKFDNLFNRELESVFELFYQTAALKDLKAEKDSLLSDSNNFNNQVVDHKNQVSNYENRLSSNKMLLKDYRELYQESLAHKPKKPNAAKRLLTLGAKQKSYHRDIDEWHKIYEPVIKAYFDINEDVKIDQEELEHHQRALQLKEIQLKKLSRELDKNSTAIFNTISEDDNIQEKLSKHLVPIINLLRIGRKVAELKIDSEFLAPIKIEQMNLEILPDSTMQRLNEFTHSLKTEITTAFKEVSLVDTIVPTKKDEVKTDENNGSNNANKISKLTELTSKKIASDNVAITKGQSLLMEKQILDTALIAIDIVEETAKLKKLEIENFLARNLYESKLEELRQQFKTKVDAVNDRSQVLAQVIKSINTSEQQLQVDSLKELIETEDDFWITDMEVIATFKSGKSITI
ncbi:hypothetical protein [Nonlabens antarcticus]|uniref:hypothetical protein n=1 Tax=Nonlabens antarcticus TaxID=392714 RepID=UPI0018917C50|nr:hypothetical protein [Nonlabens antarcticus]